MEAVGPPVLRNGLVGRRKGLAQHLSAEDAPKTEILALAAENIFLDLLQLQEIEQLSQHIFFDADAHIRIPLFNVSRFFSGINVQL